MDSYHLRLLITGLFVTFLVIVVLSDLIKRLPKRRVRQKQKSGGFRPMKPPPSGILPDSSWKAGPRR